LPSQETRTATDRRDVEYGVVIALRDPTGYALAR
jgi:hypothetical protein